MLEGVLGVIFIDVDMEFVEGWGKEIEDIADLDQEGGRIRGIMDLEGVLVGIESVALEW